jgi:hypothetical protein
LGKEIKSQNEKVKVKKKNTSAVWSVIITAPLLFTTVVLQLNQGTTKGTGCYRSFLDFFPMHRDYFLFVKKKKVTKRRDNYQCSFGPIAEACSHVQHQTGAKSVFCFSFCLIKKKEKIKTA